jgi:putative membrane protein
MSILYIQALPALIALFLVMRSKRRRAGEARLFS